MPARPVAAHGDAPPMAALERALFRVSKAVWAAKLTGTSAGATVERASVALLGRLTECGETRLSELACMLGVDVSTASRQVRHLADLGLLDRSPDPSDGRAQRLRVSARGRRVVEQVRAARASLLADALAGWSPGDRDTLTDLLVRLADDLGPVLVPRQENP